jgi:hypothetical protein
LLAQVAVHQLLDKLHALELQELSVLLDQGSEARLFAQSSPRRRIGACFLMMTHARLERSPNSASNSAAHGDSAAVGQQQRNNGGEGRRGWAVM